jgi:hypothetical protein
MIPLACDIVSLELPDCFRECSLVCAVSVGVAMTLQHVVWIVLRIDDTPRMLRE